MTIFLLEGPQGKDMSTLTKIVTRAVVNALESKQKEGTNESDDEPEVFDATGLVQPLVDICWNFRPLGLEVPDFRAISLADDPRVLQWASWGTWYEQ